MQVVMMLSVLYPSDWARGNLSSQLISSYFGIKPCLKGKICLQPLATPLSTCFLFRCCSLRWHFRFRYLKPFVLHPIFPHEWTSTMPHPFQILLSKVTWCSNQDTTCKIGLGISSSYWKPTVPQSVSLHSKRVDWMGLGLVNAKFMNEE